MRNFLALAIIAVFLQGCADRIPLRDDFGTSALAPKGKIPPEFAEFNNYDPQVNPIVASQICATSYIQMEQRSQAAQPGELSVWRGRCEPYHVVELPP
jgi:hypothetical protein